MKPRTCSIFSRASCCGQPARHRNWHRGFRGRGNRPEPYHAPRPPLTEQLPEFCCDREKLDRDARAGRFGGLALLLASVGLYGITAYSVARRTSEIGLRAALGATPLRVVRMILGGAMAQAAVGIAVGIPLAWGAGQLLATQLFGVKGSDGAILAGAATVLAVCAAAAGAIPAYRASRLDPVQALRTDR